MRRPSGPARSTSAPSVRKAGARSPDGANPRPVLLTGTQELCGRPLDEAFYKGLDDLVRDQVMAMKTTFTPGHYRRRVASVLARRLVTTLFEQG